jgi:hypothetical protein
MILYASATLLTPDAQPRVSATAQATATIRVVEGVRVKLDGSHNKDVPSARATVIKESDGSLNPAKVIDFE